MSDLLAFGSVLASELLKIVHGGAWTPILWSAIAIVTTAVPLMVRCLYRLAVLHIAVTGSRDQDRADVVRAAGEVIHRRPRRRGQGGSAT